ncbi:MAG TPA: COX15/CtaA family protein [Pirellulaceae bacterium]|nr:COX15/CtaA family protein [Pirellulaceae bacterium]HMO91363.1 COX15/CtaA family protein [Pirellulaceae bacterium]HMP70245.1 COX15/CtaA family protein [Pirellulaceae bacterium]
MIERARATQGDEAKRDPVRLDEKLHAIAYRRLPHVLAVLCALIVFPLIWMGGLVTTHAAGMAVPDWPNTYGYNLLLYPYYDWFFGPWDLFVEHGHRLLGALAGFVAILLVVASYWQDQRRWFRRLTVLALLLIIVQGLLGGARVLLDQRTLALVHGSVGPLFFALISAIAIMSSRWWHSMGGYFSIETASLECQRTVSKPYLPTIFTRLSLTLLIASYLQLLIGANMRHVLESAEPNWYYTLVLSHVWMATLVLILAILIFFVSRNRGFGDCGVRWLAGSLAGLVVAQICLGVSTWIVKFGVPALFNMPEQAEQFLIVERTFVQTTIITAHVAVGSLILAMSTCLSVRCLRVFWPILMLMPWEKARSKNLFTKSTLSHEPQST